MRTYLDCIPCFFRQALEAARISTRDEKLQKEVLDRVSLKVPEFPLTATPVEMGEIIHKIIKEVTGNHDPYKELKKLYNEKALKYYPKLKKLVKNSSDPILMSIKIAIAGNIIDFGPTSNFDLDKSIEEAVKGDFAISDYDTFKDLLNQVDEILYIGDNAGEICFDKILVEELIAFGKKVTFVVREEPIINDATMEDAIFCGMDKIARVISSGSKAPGTIVSHCNKEFQKIFFNSRFIISKGQGNFETLSDFELPIFFLLKVKCPVIGRELGAKTGDIILKLNPNFRRTLNNKR